MSFRDFFQRFWPRSLRAQVMLAMVPVLTLAFVISGYVLLVNGKEALLQEKRTHLLGVSPSLTSTKKHHYKS
jgi:hypothetical protein